MAVIDWLLEGDPAVRWQVMRDLLDATPAEYGPEQGRVATEGWGARLLAEQRPDGRWTTNTYGLKWVSTFYSMQLLWLLGPDPECQSARLGAEVLLQGLCLDGGLLYGPGERGKPPRFGETCISGMGLAICSRFLPGDPRLDQVVDYLLRDATPDGGWNCLYRRRGDAHASFNTTICVLEGLLEFERRHGARQDVTAARQRGHELLLQHHLFRSHTTGAVVRRQYTMLSFPARWHYDILRALDYFAAAGAPRDERAAEAVEIVRSKRRTDGAWPLQHRHTGDTYFEMEHPREPSRWNTLRALRMLRWWEG